MLERIEHTWGRGYGYSGDISYRSGDGFGYGYAKGFDYGYGYGFSDDISYHTFPSTWHITDNLLPNLMVEVRC